MLTNDQLSAKGRANRVKGHLFMRQCVDALRRAGWPNAEIIPSHYRADITGVDDLVIECKAEKSWTHLSEELGKVAMEAERRDMPWYVIWRKAWGHTDPLSGYWVMRARDGVALWERFCELQAVEREHAQLVERLAASGAMADFFRKHQQQQHQEATS